MRCAGTENEILHERYAKVLMDAAKEAGRIDEILGELKLLNDLLCADRPFSKILCHPEIDKDEKKQFLERISERLRFSQELRLFVWLLVDKNRIDILHGIFLKYRDMYDVEKKRQKVYVSSAVSLGREQIRRLKDIIGKRLNKDTAIEEVTDPSVIGGVNIKIGDRVYNLSLADRLRYLEEMLIGQ